MSFFTKDKLKNTAIAIAVTFFWLVVWQLAYMKVAQELLLVSPAQAFMRLFELAATASFWKSIAVTCLRVMSGFALSIVTGVALAALSYRFGIVKTFVSPLFLVIRSTPVVSFIILAFLWFKTDNLPVFIAFLMVVPMVWSNIYTAINSVDRNLLEMAKIFKFSSFQKIKTIFFPTVVPHFISDCSVGLGFAWKSAIAAEVICLPKAAVGRQINNARVYLETRDLFAWTIAVIILSLLLEKLIIKALNNLGNGFNFTDGKDDNNG